MLKRIHVNMHVIRRNRVQRLRHPADQTLAWVVAEVEFPVLDLGDIGEVHLDLTCQVSYVDGDGKTVWGTLKSGGLTVPAPPLAVSRLPRSSYV